VKPATSRPKINGAKLIDDGAAACHPGAAMTTLKQTYQWDGLPYTDKEMAIYRLIASVGAVKTADVVQAIYRDAEHPNARIIVCEMMRNLRRKLDLNGHRVGLAGGRVRRGGRGGPFVWRLVPRSRAETERAVRRARASRRDR
jgi:hypothetical protein